MFRPEAGGASSKPSTPEVAQAETPGQITPVSTVAETARDDQVDAPEAGIADENTERGEASSPASPSSNVRTLLDKFLPESPTKENEVKAITGVLEAIDERETISLLRGENGRGERI